MLGETDSWKKPEVENLVTLSLLGAQESIPPAYAVIEDKFL